MGTKRKVRKTLTKGKDQKEFMVKLKYAFNPSSVAVVGATPNTTKIGHVVLRDFVKSFPGKIYPVNPKYDEILDLKCYPRVTSIPGKLDLVVIVVPAHIVPSVMNECAKKDVKSVIIISGGFKEVGNVELEEEIKKIADENNIPVIGPNCLGVVDTYSGVDTIFNPRYKMNRPRQGKISFITQSGAVGAVVMDWAGSKGFGVSKFISYGNALNVDEVDLLEYLGRDPKTKVICAYLEGTRRGKELIQTAKKVSRKKPTIAIKSGRTSEGAKAVASHTGSLAGSSAVWNTAFKQSGMIQAKRVDAMFDYARLFANQPLPKGDKVAIVTNGGGFGVMATDACIYYGLKLAKFEKKTLDDLRKKLPPYAVFRNPLDLVGDADAERYRLALEAVMNDKNVDSVMCILLFQTTDLGSEAVEVVSEINDKYKKPLLVVSSGGEYAQLHMRLLEKSGIPTYDTMSDAARSLAGLTFYEEFLSAPVSIPHELKKKSKD